MLNYVSIVSIVYELGIIFGGHLAPLPKQFATSPQVTCMCAWLYSVTSPFILHRFCQVLKGAVVVTLCQNEADVKCQMDIDSSISLTEQAGKIRLLVLCWNLVLNSHWKLYFCLILTEARANCSFQGLILSIHFWQYTHPMGSCRPKLTAGGFMNFKAWWLQSAV